MSECQGADEEIRNGEPEAEVEGAEKSLPESVTTAKKLQNKANSDFADLKQETESQELRSEAAETGGENKANFPGGAGPKSRARPAARRPRKAASSPRPGTWYSTNCWRRRLPHFPPSTSLLLRVKRRRKAARSGYPRSI